MIFPNCIHFVIVPLIRMALLIKARSIVHIVMPPTWSNSRMLRADRARASIVVEAEASRLSLTSYTIL